MGPGFVDGSGGHFRQFGQADGQPPGLWSQATGTLERVNIDFSNTLSDFAGVLKRQFELQNLTAYWKAMYERLYDDYRNLDDRYEDVSATHVQMSIELTKRDEAIQRKDELIAALEAEIHRLQLETAGQRLVALGQQQAGELVNAPVVDLGDWVASPTELVYGKQASKSDGSSLASV